MKKEHGYPLTNLKYKIKEKNTNKDSPTICTNICYECIFFSDSGCSAHRVKRIFNYNVKNQKFIEYSPFEKLTSSNILLD